MSMPPKAINGLAMLREILKIIGWILFGSAVAVATVIIADKIIDWAVVRAEVKKKAPSAFKALIEQKKKNAIDVGIFSKEGNRIDGMTLESDKGVASDIEVGQELYL